VPAPTGLRDVVFKEPQILVGYLQLCGSPLPLAQQQQRGAFSVRAEGNDLQAQFRRENDGVQEIYPFVDLGLSGVPRAKKRAPEFDLPWEPAFPPSDSPSDFAAGAVIRIGTAR